MLRAFCYLCFQGFLVVAVLVVVLAGLNWGFGWDLGLSIGASDLAIPKEPGDALFLAFALLVIALFFRMASDLKAVLSFLKAHKAITALGTILVLLGLFFAVQYLRGGALGIAVDQGDRAEVQSLLAQKQYESEKLNDSLYQALRKGETGIAEDLIKAGADPNEKRGEFQTPLLHSAATWFDDESVLLLVAQGADPGQTDQLGRTAIHNLLLYRQPNRPGTTDEDLAKLLIALLQAGADPAHQSNNGDTAESLAKEYELEECLRVIESHSPKGHQPGG